MTLVKPRRQFEWQLRSRRLALGGRTLIMAIINLTPDSFSGDGLLTGGARGALTKVGTAAAVEAWDNGADILDLGAESTRPNAQPLSAQQEQDRLLPVLECVLIERPEAVISVDTYHAETAQMAVRMGAEIVNDVSGLTWDAAMAETVAGCGCGLVLMHTRGLPGEWVEQAAMPPEEVVPTIFGGLCESVAVAEAAGIATGRILVDPGFGFGKRGAANFALLGQLSRLNQLGRPLLVGVSRKHFLGEAVAGVQAQKLPPAAARGTATVAANTIAALAGAHVLRVHEVQPAREAAAIADAVLNQVAYQARAEVRGS